MHFVLTLVDILDGRALEHLGMVSTSEWSLKTYKKLILTNIHSFVCLVISIFITLLKTQNCTDKLRSLFRNSLLWCDTFFQTLHYCSTLFLLAKQHTSGKDCPIRLHQSELTKIIHKNTFNLDNLSYFCSLSSTLLFTPASKRYLKPLNNVDPPERAILLYSFLLESIGQSCITLSTNSSTDCR